MNSYTKHVRFLDSKITRLNKFIVLLDHAAQTCIGFLRCVVDVLLSVWCWCIFQTRQNHHSGEGERRSKETRNGNGGKENSRGKKVTHIKGTHIGIPQKVFLEKTYLFYRN